jgi:alpha-L-glutamate ligase-like protein
MHKTAIIRPWAWPRELRKRGVLGINRRNVQYLFELNPRHNYKFVDDKIVTKQLCHTHGIAVPKTHAIIERFGDAKRLATMIGEHLEFVVKPASGSGGRGVLVIVGRDGESFVGTKGERISFSEIRYHVCSTLSGLYSLAGQSDRVIIEQRIRPHSIFEGLSVGGTPDVRVIMYRGWPAQAMLRLPTKASGGRANLHQGAIAAGIDLETGRTLGGVWRNRAIATHPDTGLAIGGLIIPHWSRILATAQSLSAIIQMGYIGVDIVLDVNEGPVVLEANARPGLAVQTANRTGLLDLLAEIDKKISSSGEDSRTYREVLVC